MKKMKKHTVKQLDWPDDFVIGDIIEYDEIYSDFIFENEDLYGKHAIRYQSIRYQAMIIAIGFNDGEFLLDNGIQTTKYGLKSLNPVRWFP